MHYLRQFASEFGRDIHGLAPAARYKLLVHNWPGNVRELKHVVERGVLLAKGRLLEPHDIDIDGSAEKSADDDSFRDAKSRVVETFERGYIEHVLTRCNGNITHAARIAKKNRRAFFQLMRKHSIEPARFRSQPG
jgi:DNA-binding NtrC family response regulator